MTRNPVSLTLDNEIVKDLDDYLDNKISRSSAVNIIIRKYLDNPNGLI